MLPFFTKILFKLGIKEYRFYCEKLTSCEENKKLIMDFYIEREKGIYDCPNTIVGLQQYLRKKAWDDDIENINTIYLIKDRKTKMIAAYFGLKAGMVSLKDTINISNEEKNRIEQIRIDTLSEGYKPINQSIPGIELSHFAINDSFRQALVKGTNRNISGLGYYFFPKFIYPIIIDVHNKIGVKFFYLYAADSSGENKLVNYYRNVMGLDTLNDSSIKVDSSVLKVKPIRADYDNKCIFMYRAINDKEKTSICNS